MIILIKSLLVKMETKAQNTKTEGALAVKRSLVPMATGPCRESTESRQLLTKLRKISQGEPEGLEKLAALEHDQWAGWMRCLFEKSYLGTGGSILIPPHLVARWKRQMQTPYAQLPPEEQESDRIEARKVLGLKWLEEDQCQLW